MGHYHSEQSFLAALPASFRAEVEASAALILQKITPPTADRIENLAALAAAEAVHAPTERQAQAAYALAAELKRRSRLLHH